MRTPLNVLFTNLPSSIVTVKDALDYYKQHQTIPALAFCTEHSEIKGQVWSKVLYYNVMLVLKRGGVKEIDLDISGLHSIDANKRLKQILAHFQINCRTAAIDADHFYYTDSFLSGSTIALHIANLNQVQNGIRLAQAINQTNCKFLVIDAGTCSPQALSFLLRYLMITSVVKVKLIFSTTQPSCVQREYLGIIAQLPESVSVIKLVHFSLAELRDELPIVLNTKPSILHLIFNECSMAPGNVPYSHILTVTLSTKMLDLIDPKLIRRFFDTVTQCANVLLSGQPGGEGALSTILARLSQSHSLSYEQVLNEISQFGTNWSFSSPLLATHLAERSLSHSLSAPLPAPKPRI